MVSARSGLAIKNYLMEVTSIQRIGRRRNAFLKGRYKCYHLRSPLPGPWLPTKVRTPWTERPHWALKFSPKASLSNRKLGAWVLAQQTAAVEEKVGPNLSHDTVLYWYMAEDTICLACTLYSVEALYNGKDRRLCLYRFIRDCRKGLKNLSRKISYNKARNTFRRAKK